MDIDELEDITPDVVADARGSACPGPLLEAKKSIGSVGVGGIVEVRSSDPASREDIPVWTERVGHEFLGVLEADEGYDRIFVRRGK
ncbi:MAG TPA: sulfurtransferase TusA family protein [Thermoleophilia bacterium]|nr:sulfurtransferase TusA family protein [Thermoleophilia bacterium]